MLLLGRVRKTNGEGDDEGILKPRANVAPSRKQLNSQASGRVRRLTEVRDPDRESEVRSVVSGMGRPMSQDAVAESRSLV